RNSIGISASLLLRSDNRPNGSRSGSHWGCSSPLSAADSLYSLIANQLATPLVYLLIPLSIGMALLRYRLWDIDLIIKRTLVCGLRTLTLALVYGVFITSVQRLFSGVIAQDNPLVLVGSTLVIAALFQPLRHRIQAIIDRRFYRRKYDAART